MQPLRLKWEKTSVERNRPRLFVGLLGEVSMDCIFRYLSSWTIALAEWSSVVHDGMECVSKSACHFSGLKSTRSAEVREDVSTLGVVVEMYTKHDRRSVRAHGPETCHWTRDERWKCTLSSSRCSQ